MINEKLLEGSFYFNTEILKDDIVIEDDVLPCVLKNGLKIMELLNVCANYGFIFTFNSKRSLKDKLNVYEKILLACTVYGIKCPVFNIFPVHDQNLNNKSSHPIVTFHNDIMILSYGIERDDKSCVRNTLKSFYNIDSKFITIIDDNSNVINSSVGEGYNGYFVKSDSDLYDILLNIVTKFNNINKLISV